jgi:hypothetical protein
MSDNEKIFPGSLDIKIGASAEIKTEIPSVSSGRFIDAVTDIFRPFSERRGLRGDQIRLQREDILIEIAKKTRERMQVEGLIPHSIPNRVLIPFLEKASLIEEEDELLIKNWSNILLSASKGLNANHAIFVDILGKLDSAHINFLTFLAQPENSGAAEDEFLRLIEDVIKEDLKLSLTQILSEIKRDESNLQEVVEKHSAIIQNYFRTRGSCLISGGIDLSTILIGSYSYFDLYSNSDYELFPESISESLEGLNIIKRISIRNISVKSAECWVEFTIFTLFGLEFFYACHSGRNIWEID